jgi:hypothetical protein
VSIWIQDSKRLKQDCLLPSLRPAWFQHLQAQHEQIQDQLTSIQGWDKKTRIVWQEFLFHNIFIPKCVASVLPSQQLEEDRCTDLIPVMGKAVEKQQNEQLGNIICCSSMGGQIIHSFCHADQISVSWFLLIRRIRQLKLLAMPVQNRL